MGNLIELTGQRFGMLTVIRFDRLDAGWHAWWWCRCDCGGEKSVRSKCLRRGVTKSCGCQSSRYVRTRRSKHDATAGGDWSPEYQSWSNMRSRCMNPRLPAYKDYGGRGITICDRWQGPDGFVTFLADMGPRPSLNHSLDRIDNDGNYEPGNCRWATREEQCRNRRSNNPERRGNRLLTLNGETKTLAEWCKITGLKHSTVNARVKLLGWSEARALTTPARGSPRPAPPPAPPA